MRGYKRKKTRQAELTQFGLKIALTAGLLFFAGVSVHSAWGMYGKYTEASQQQDIAQTQLQQLQTQSANINNAISTIQSPEGKEAVVRERYGVAKPGEGEIQIVTSQDAQSATSTVSESFLDKLRQAFSFKK